MVPEDNSNEHDKNNESTEGNVHQSHWNESTERPSMVVIRSLAACSGKDPLTLDPINHSADLEALDKLFGNGKTDISVSFSVDQYEITITEGCIEVRECP
ncbi:hypothetical protein HYG81_21375 (plasmid) [Natrinema zhouii]|uniref:HalOD1 output domain-containing protein n=1 Tax=Natrinema zhouii TaxID=1710539 RepID=UPI001CFFCC40|nr:HalOD1 output domain-containing protein [Natrinema zhouii]UHQ98132.1 hypothetical protein HYG81_21375 [Natrinema zhouii]